ncbi:MAG: DNA/RNA helicase, superfamily I [Candidatus Nomurabacteria bacterium GW2011_GWB1_40_7]|uniref:DNA 3'-5' helicase n=1 Tax=Candidatus Nomurabacteria bacterium GW2011_GWB1_40_7 TaxID=1618744 RepID=A0A0G0T0U8_9BACT|nr:MAG: DNA/RNA helicase, superfamily I [Candidatus Nomurabacteria bacterium GW2011_GWB1_40_7]
MTLRVEGEYKNEYKKLNKAQKEAVEAIDGPVMVVAGPGTGKTKILTFRIANILLKTDTAPESILALTYTTAGVISMREKLLEIIGDRAYRVNIFTFHAFCEHIIKEFSFYFENLEGFRVIGDLDRVEIIESIIKKNKFEHLISFHDEFSFLNKIVDSILAIKKEGLLPKEFIKKLPIWEKELLANEDLYYKKDYGEYKKGAIKPAEKEKINKKIDKAKELGEIFSLYQMELKKRGLYDFSDMILYALEELSKNKNLKADVQEKYQYILVDEHQDTNEGQNELIELLTDAPHLEGKPNLFTVGDEKQSIYRFQGASAETFSRFQNLYKNIRSITLSENYRSAQNILDGAHSLVIKIKDLEKSAELHSNAKVKNEKINIRKFSNYKFELLYLAEGIKAKIENGIAPSEIAVLYRANKNVSDIKTIFDFYRIPYTIFSKDKILDDPNIANLINILRVIYNPNDDHHLGKVFFANFLKFDAYDSVRILDKLKSLRKEERKHLFAIMEDKKVLKEIEVKNSDDFFEFAKTVKELKIESNNQNFPDFFKTFLEKIGYLKYMIGSVNSRAQLVKLDKFLDEIKRQNETKKNYGIADFIYFVDSFIKYNLDIKSTDPEIIEGVSLMTAHGSKGREFEYVYIINTTRKSWEGRNGGNSISLPIYQYDGSIEDERRLFYVAMTRAKNSLNISFARTDNDGREHEESEFVKEINGTFKKEENMKSYEEKNIDGLASFMNFEKYSASLFDPEYLRHLFFKRGLNVSALNNYLNCPKKYLYKNLIRIPDIYSVSMKFGSIVDFALNKFFEKSKKESKILPKKVLLEEFDKGLNRFNLSEKDEEKFRERGERALSEYYDEYSNEWTDKTETQFHIERDFELDNKEILKISGTLDKIEYVGNVFSSNINIIDHKTGKSFSEKTKEQKADYERQLIFYKLLLTNYDKKDFKIKKSILDFVEKNKKGKFEQYSFDVTKEHLEELKKEINTCAEDVLSMEFLKKGCNKKDCEWCQFGR